VDAGAAGVDGSPPDAQAATDAAVIDPVACLRAADASQIMAWTAPPALEELTSSFLPIVDGPGGVLPDLPANLIAAGQLNKEAAILAGTNEFEWGLLDQLSGAPTSITSAAQFDQLVDMELSSIAPQIDALYPVATDADAENTYLSILTDYFFRCPTRDLALATTAHGTKNFFMYSYDVGRAFHSDELLALFHVDGPFFPTVVPPATTPSADFQAQMQGYWTRFAATGDPNAPGAPSWPTYSAAAEQELVLSDPLPAAATATLKPAACQFWDAQMYSTTAP
jgi:para-nitrobenzyl esterase